VNFIGRLDRSKLAKAVQRRTTPFGLAHCDDPGQLAQLPQ
jgi:hypothetical protein